MTTAAHHPVMKEIATTNWDSFFTEKRVIAEVNWIIHRHEHLLTKADFDAGRDHDLVDAAHDKALAMWDAAVSAPGKARRDGVSLVQLMDRFPNEDAAREWCESARWGDQRACPRCGSTKTRPVPSWKPMRYHCGGCRQYFSVKTGAVMQSSDHPEASSDDKPETA